MSLERNHHIIDQNTEIAELTKAEQALSAELSSIVSDILETQSKLSDTAAQLTGHLSVLEDKKKQKITLIANVREALQNNTSRLEALKKAKQTENFQDHPLSTAELKPLVQAADFESTLKEIEEAIQVASHLIHFKTKLKQELTDHLEFLRKEQKRVDIAAKQNAIEIQIIHCDVERAKLSLLLASTGDVEDIVKQKAADFSPTPVLAPLAECKNVDTSSHSDAQDPANSSKKPDLKRSITLLASTLEDSDDEEEVIADDKNRKPAKLKETGDSNKHKKAKVDTYQPISITKTTVSSFSYEQLINQIHFEMKSSATQQTQTTISVVMDHCRKSPVKRMELEACEMAIKLRDKLNQTNVTLGQVPKLLKDLNPTNKSYLMLKSAYTEVTNSRAKISIPDSPKPAPKSPSLLSGTKIPKKPTSPGQCSISIKPKNPPSVSPTPSLYSGNPTVFKAIPKPPALTSSTSAPMLTASSALLDH